MRRTCFSLAAAALMLTPIGSAMAQGKPATAPAASSAGLAAEMAEAVNRAAKNLIDMAEDFPESKYDYRSTPEVRTFAEQLLHAAQANMTFAGLLSGKTGRADELKRDTYKTKAQVVEVLKKSVSDFANAVKAKGDAGLLQPITLGNRTVTTVVFLTGAIGHMQEHLGQLVQYYRLNKMVPPESRPKKTTG